MMEADSQHIEALFESLLNESTEQARALRLDLVGRDQPELRARLTELLRSHFEAPGFLGDAARRDLQQRIGEVATERIGHYSLLEKVGEGGFGEVWMAEQRAPVRRRVALKVLKPGMDSRQVIARFEAERQALALMDHPCIARIFDAGTTGAEVENSIAGSQIPAGRPYFVMELVPGIRITDYCDQNRLRTAARLRLFIRVCQAIQHAHQKGVIHRDIKPSNILVTVVDGEPVPKVIDFGIAKAVRSELTEHAMATLSGQFIGTPAYISPEQAELGGVDVDTRADIYSLGVLLYELLVGQTPFDTRALLHRGLDAWRHAICSEDPPTPSTRLKQLPAPERTETAERRTTEPATLTRLLRGDLDWIVMKCLEKDRARRYDTANGLGMDLTRHLNHEPVLARPPNTAYRLQKAWQRNRLAFVAAAAIGGALMVVLALSLAFGWREHRHTLQLQVDLAHQHLVRGQSLCLQGEVSRGLHWMVRALEAVPPSGTELISTIRQNLASWSARTTAPLAVLPHEGTARSVACSPDGTRLLTGSEDHTAKLWRADSGEPIGQPMVHGGPVLLVQFSPDGQRVLTASRDKTVRLWSGTNGSPLGPVLHHAAEPTAALFRPDSQAFLTATSDGTVGLWSVASCEPLGPRRHQGSAVRTATVSPSGDQFLTGGADGTVRFWTGDRAEPLEPGIQLRGPVHALVISPDGKRLLTGGADRTARLWDLATRRQVGPSLTHRGIVYAVAFSPDGSQLLTGGADGIARLWSADTGEPIGQEMQHGAPVLVAKFTPDGRRVITGSENNTATVWSAESGMRLAPPIRHEGWVSSLAFSPDGRKLLTGADDHSAKLWSLDPESGAALTFAHGGSVKTAAFSPDGLSVVTGGRSNQVWGGSVRLWSARTGEPGPVIPHPGFVWTAVFSPDGQSLLTGGVDGSARLWSTTTLAPHPIGFHHALDVRCAAFSRDNRWIATAGFDKTAVVWSRETGAARHPPFPHSQYVEEVAFSPDGALLATACGDGVVRFWSLETGQQAGPSLAHRGSVLAVAFSPDGRHVATGCTDRAARIWDLHDGIPVGSILEHPTWVEDVAFSPDGAQLATGDAFDSAWVWSVSTGELLAPPFLNDGPVNEIEFSPDGRRLLAASHDGMARAWTLLPPFRGTVIQARSWVEAQTGQAMDEHGVMSWLTAKARRERQAEHRVAQ